MAFDEQLAQRVRDYFRESSVPFEEKRMMGGVCLLVDGKMCLGIEKDRLMCRIDPADYEAALQRPGCIPMDFTGKPMRGFVFVNPDGTDSREDLLSWIRLALEFNPRAVASRQRRKTADGQTSKSTTKKESRAKTRKSRR